MNQIRQFFAGIALLAFVFLSAGCTPSNPQGGDTTAPGFVQVMIRLEVPGDPNPRGEFDITSADVIKGKLDPNLIIRILATAGDSESGITMITLAANTDPLKGDPFTYNLSWKCGAAPNPDPNSVLVSVLQFGLLPFTLNAPPAPPPALWQIEATADPIATTGCTIDRSTGVGPIGVGGFVRLITTNGAGLTSQSGTFIFDYTDIGTGQ